MERGRARDEQLEVIEHQAQSRRCNCGATTKAAFPGEARPATCYGPVVRGIAVYLMVRKHVPVANWFHVACTELLSLVDCHEKRGVEAFADIGVLPFFSGVLVSDGWKPY